ncbi:hypothetical protein [Agromyces ramosus]|uniref:Uncharacterized protein n=1 Tax=Agromyces ramosus TaxID=33879 RepID=A0ABU0R8R3_9MICO|nr:hypothetical protein [Agromyces ramosus]MDQ0894463.1 hypothetical protein [Agromyces ramosus]
MSPRDASFDDIDAYDPEELIEGYKAPQWLPTLLDNTDNRKD